jgi:hypothetical protein
MVVVLSCPPWYKYLPTTQGSALYRKHCNFKIMYMKLKEVKVPNYFQDNAKKLKIT